MYDEFWPAELEACTVRPLAGNVCQTLRSGDMGVWGCAGSTPAEEGATGSESRAGAEGERVEGHREGEAG